MSRLPGKYILLAAACIAVMFLIFRNRAPFGKNNTSFAVSPGTEITAISLLQGEEKLTLQKRGERWTVNKKDEVRKSAVSFMINTLREIKVKSPVSPEVFSKEIISPKIEPVRVNVYHKRRLIKSFYVYKTGSNIYGNMMKMGPSSKPFIVYIPGFEGNIGSHFVVNELFWKPFSAFSLLPSQINSIELQNMNDPSQSFTVAIDRGSFSLSDASGSLTGWDTVKLRRYVSYFTSVPFESWAFEIDEQVSKEIESSAPVYVFQVKRTDGEVFTLTVWDKWKEIDGKRVKDTDRVWARKGHTDELVIMRYFDIDPVLKKKSYFFGE